MNQLPMLLKREYWEHRTTFLYLPAIMSMLFIGILLFGSFAIQSGVVNVSIDSERHQDGNHQTEEFKAEGASLLEIFGHRINRFADQSFSEREQVLNQVYYSTSVIMFVVLWFVIVFYFINCLYDDRKDRSILFWKSLPVSDAMTVVSKLIVGLIVVPTIFLAFTMINNVALLLVSSISALGNDIDIFSTLWAPANIIGRWVTFVGYILFAGIWCLPFFGWLLLISSWAKSAPLAWVVGIPLLITIVERIFTGSGVVRAFFMDHLALRQPVVWLQDGYGSELSVVSMQTFASLILGVVLVGLAIWRRGYADEL